MKMKNSCQIVRDLIPLYVDRVASEDSRKYVAEHIRGCETCRRYLRQLQEKMPAQSRETAQQEEALFREAAQQLVRKRRRRFLRNVLIGMLAGTLLFFVYFLATYELYFTVV